MRLAVTVKDGSLFFVPSFFLFAKKYKSQSMHRDYFRVF